MSHEATNWAIKQRGIKPALKVVLWHLCDCYNPEYGSFPSQEYLADHCEVPRSTLNVYLGELERIGLIVREQRRKKGSNHQERTRYYLPFEADFERKKAQNPCPETGHGVSEPVSGNEGEPSPENGDTRVQNLDSNLVREPVKEPVIEREGARDASEDRPAETSQSIEREFRRWFPTWPTYDVDSETEARKEWFKLSAEERREVASFTAAYVEAAKRHGRGKFCAPSVYLKERRWAHLAEKARASGRVDALGKAQVPHKPLSKAWQALAISLFFEPEAPLPAMTITMQRMVSAGGPMAERLRREHRQRWAWPKVSEIYAEGNLRHVVVPPHLVAASDDFRSYHIASPEGQAWRRFYDRLGWVWPPMGEAEWICFPPIEPEGDLDLRASEALEHFHHQISDYLSARSRGNDDAA